PLIVAPAAMESWLGLKLPRGNAFGSLTNLLPGAIQLRRCAHRGYFLVAFYIQQHQLLRNKAHLRRAHGIDGELKRLVGEFLRLDRTRLVVNDPDRITLRQITGAIDSVDSSDNL